MARPLHRIGKDARGVSVIEFAFVAPLLALFLVGIIDAGRAFSAKLTLDQTVFRALETATVGTSQTDYDTILRNEVMSTSGYSSSDVITVTQWLECDLHGATTTLPYNGNCAPTEQSTRYIKLQVDRQFAPSFSYGRAFLGANSAGQITISSSWQVRMQ